MKVLAIIPCYNEEGAIKGLLEQFSDLSFEVDTLVINDCSTDNTYAIVKNLSKVVNLSQNLGIGGAVQTGIKYAYENDYKYCVQIDGDGQHIPEEIINLYRRIDKDKYNIVIGSRFIDGLSFRSTYMRRLGLNVISKLIELLFGFRVKDPTSGMRMFDRSAMKFFVNHYPSDYPEPISLARALRHGLSILEIPVKMKPREYGSSSITSYKSISYMLRVIGYIIIARIETPRNGGVTDL